MATIEEIRAEAIRSRAFIRGAETQLSKVLALIDEAPPEPEPDTDALSVVFTTYHTVPA